MSVLLSRNTAIEKATTEKKKHCPVGPMTITSQSPPAASEMQPQMQQNQQPTTNNTALNLSSFGQGT